MINLFAGSAVVLLSVWGACQVNGQARDESSATVSQKDRRPNIILILSDDQRAGTLACEGNLITQTPNIDALAYGGVRFAKSFVTTSICSVSRASIMSGQYERRHRISNFAKGFSPAQWAETYPALLRKSGYYTGFIGKFGVGDSAVVEAMKSEFDYGGGRPGQGGPFFDPKDPEHTHMTARLGSEAVAFIEKASQDKPFYLTLSFNAPHARDGAPREFEPDSRDEKLYEDAQIPVPSKSHEKFYQMLPEVARHSEGRERWKRRFSNPEQFQATVRDYLRLVTGIDREVGRIQEALEKRGIDNNTVVIYMADNGFFYGERGLADKWLMYEESIHVPLIINDPRMADNLTSRVIDKLTLNIDLAPTILEMAALPAPSRMQGRSLVPLLQGAVSSDWRKDFFYEHHFGENRKPQIPANEGIREDRWKYIRWTSASPVYEELYDLESDPEELNNLASSPDHAGQLNRLRTRWSEMAKSVE